MVGVLLSIIQHFVSVVASTHINGIYVSRVTDGGQGDVFVMLQGVPSGGSSLIVPEQGAGRREHC